MRAQSKRRAYCGIAMLSWMLAAPALAATDVGQLYQEGVKERLAGRPEAAIPIFSRALAVDPNNADLLLQQGLAMSATGRDDEAIRLFEAVLRIAPNYTDASEALARVHARRAGATDATARAATLEPRFRLDVGAGHSHLSGGRPSWKDGTVRLAYQLSPRTTVSGGVDVSRRFNDTDTYGEVRIDRRNTERLSSHFYAGGAPAAHFLPKAAVGLGGQYRLDAAGGPSATYGSLDLRYARYVSGDVWSAHAGVVQYLDNDRIWLTVKSINTLDENKKYLGGYLLRMDWQVQARLRVLAGYANAPESSDGRTVRTRSVFGGVVVDLTPAFGVNLTAAREKREGLYDRDSIGAGLTYRF